MVRSKKKQVKQQNIIQLILIVVAIILLNVISNKVFTRIDLTSEKRYTLSNATKQLLKDLDDIVFFKVYLEGDFPASFKKLKIATQDMLEEFRAYSDYVQYEFINPSEGDRQTVNNVYKSLIEKGLNPTNLLDKKEEGETRQIIFPGAIVSYKNRSIPLHLLQDQVAMGTEAIINNSIQNLEYNLANTIKKLSIGSKREKIAFIEGHGELDEHSVADIMQELSQYYVVERVQINGQLKSLEEFKTIIVAKPDSAFSEKDKFIIDQFIMKGGQSLWFIDAVFAEMDSLRARNETVGFAKNLNLDDLLFKYGVRINTNLILDLNAVPIPMVTGMLGNQPQTSFVPWYYFPLLMPELKHPIVKNLNAIKTEFISSLDTVMAKGIKKIPLLQSSRYTRIVNTPTRISLQIARKKPNEALYQHGQKTVAILLEGNFESVFKNRIPAVISENEEIDFREKSVPNKMIIVSDGDMIKNQTKLNANGQYMYYPLGFDRYTNQTYGNKDFVLNAIDYLNDFSGLISVRSRDLKLRLLDKSKVEDSRLKIQLINVAFPLILVILFGVLQHYVRKRKYTFKEKK